MRTRKTFHASMLLAIGCLLAGSMMAATFTNSASIKADDSTGALTSASGPFTVSCWFRISVPSSLNLTENMNILMDRTDGNEGANFAYLFRYNVDNGNVEFVTRGTSGIYTNTLIRHPYVERWYHVAMIRSGSSFTAFVDGRPSPSELIAVGASGGAGLSIGGVSGTSKLFYGDIIEVAFYNSALSSGLIQDRMFKDQRTFPNIKGYYKLGFATNSADFYRNFVSIPPTGTDPAMKLGTGNIDFEETDQAGEQSLFDSRRNHGQDAMAALAGGSAWSQTAFARPVPGIAFDFRYGYGSATPTTALADGSDPYDRRTLGAGWRHTFDTRIAPDQSFAERRLITWDGGIETWVKTNNVFQTRHKEYRGELTLLLDTGDYEWTTPERLVYRFRDPTDASIVMAGRLKQIRDFNGNTVTLQWNEDEGYVTNVIDMVGGNYQFKYDTTLGLLTNVSFGSWQVNFAYDGTNRLVSKTLTNTSGLYSPINTTWQFAYNTTNGLLERIVDPRGNTNLFVQYDKYGRKTNDVDALGRATRTEYGVPAKRQVRRTDPANFVWLETYDRKGHILAQQDPLTNITSHAYDTNGNRISITEPLGWKTTFGYDSRANVTARTNALGEVTRWTFHSFFNKAVQEINPLGWSNSYAYDGGGNLTNHSDALGTLVRYTYATNGLVLTSTDANGKTSSFGYDTNGFLITRTDPATNTWTFTVNDVGWKSAELNPLGQRTAYSFNVNGNVVLTVDPIFREFAKTYDANGNLLTASDAKLNLTRFGYDAANQKTNMVDRTGTNTWTYFYTTRGKPDRTVNPLGYANTNFYDAANRVIAVSDPLGNTVTNQYDANGNVVATIDPVGQRWTKTYDLLNRAVAETDPQGDTKQTSYDPAGRIQQITTPNGYPSQHFYDGRGRLTKWVDAENFQWLYDYDGNANITNITDALGGHYVMSYGPRNELLSELNQDLKQWQYAYDELLRLKTQTDPNTTVRSVIYDTAGRIQTVNFTTGRQDTYDYDPNNNLTVLTRRVGGVPTATGFNYDVLDRVIKVTDAFFFEVRYGFDPLGRATSITYPGNKVLTQKFDAVNRLTNSLDWVGRTMDYAYDKAGRLIRRAYPNGVVKTNTFDIAGQITGLTYSGGSGSNALNIALAYAYDRNGNKVGGGERGTFQWPLPTLATEQAHYTAAGRLIDRQVNNTVSNQLSAITYAYDPSGNMTNAAGQGQTWALTYDEDNRTTSLRWDAGITSKIVTNRFDALGRRISRTLDGIETRSILDLSGSMERILCDTDAGGNIAAWYVHGPDLCYKVNATNGLTCYHADAQANIIALTDGNTNLVTQYAYTPYGRSLGSTNLLLSTINSQPYTFVGSQGVMEELPGLYFMRARYYSADAGVFLSTDPVKKIGPGWKPTAYGYANGNSLSYTDADGKFAITLAFTLVNIIKESIMIDYDILVRGKSVSMRQLWGRFANAAITGAVDGAIIEYGGGLFSGPMAWAGKKATKGIATFVGNATENLISGEGSLEDAAADAFVDNYVGMGIDELSGGVAGRNPKQLASILFGKQAQQGFRNELITKSLVGTAKATGEALGAQKQSTASYTASVVAPKGSVTTGGTKTNPSGASSGSTSTGGTSGSHSSSGSSGGTSSISSIFPGFSSLSSGGSFSFGTSALSSSGFSQSTLPYSLPSNTGNFGGFGGGSSGGHGASGHW